MLNKFPEMTFKSTKWRTRQRLSFGGDLAIKGVTRRSRSRSRSKELVKDPWGEPDSIEAETETTDRDFGITYGNALPAAVLMLRTAVEITCILKR